VRAFEFAAAGVSCSGLCAELSAMGKPYPETEELLDYEEEGRGSAQCRWGEDQRRDR
jgi:hypothetical protein